MSIIPTPEGKKVFTRDGIFIGFIKKVYIAEFGGHVAIIQTNYPEFPEFEVLMTRLRSSKKQIEGRPEEVYIVPDIPIKLRMIIEEKMRATEVHPPVEQKPSAAVPLPHTQRTLQQPHRKVSVPLEEKKIVETAETIRKYYEQKQEALSQKQVIFTNKAPVPVGPYSQAVKAGPFLFVSGQIPIDPRNGNIVRGDIRVQTRYVLENIKNILAAAGYTLDDVVAVYVFLRDLTKFDEFNRIYGEYFSKSKPARVTVEVSRLPKDVLLEISLIAYRE